MQTFKGMCGPGFLKNESGEVVEKFRPVWFSEQLSVEQKQMEVGHTSQKNTKCTKNTLFAVPQAGQGVAEGRSGEFFMHFI